jgi:hypothetical protein
VSIDNNLQAGGPKSHVIIKGYRVRFVPPSVHTSPLHCHIAIGPLQIPVVTAKVNERGAALNKVRWSADGRRLLVGDVEGHTYVYEVGEVCSV